MLADGLLTVMSMAGTHRGNHQCNLATQLAAKYGYYVKG